MATYFIRWDSAPVWPCILFAGTSPPVWSCILFAGTPPRFGRVFYSLRPRPWYGHVFYLLGPLPVWPCILFAGTARSIHMQLRYILSWCSMLLVTPIPNLSPRSNGPTYIRTWLVKLPVRGVFYLLQSSGQPPLRKCQNMVVGWSWTTNN